MKKDLWNKAVVLGIALVFVFSAFIPVVGSNMGSTVTSQSSERSEKISIGIEESLGSSGYITEIGDTDYGILNVFIGTLLGVVKIAASNPIVNMVRELFSRGDVSDAVNDIDDDTNQKVDDQLNSDMQTNTLNQPLNQPTDNPGPLPLGDGPPWWNTNWQYRKEITIDSDKVDDDLTDFPVLINITDTDLRDRAQDDGDDIAFTDDSGNQLHHEIEYFDGNNGDLIAWVNVTSLSSTADTALYIYYGNAGAVNQQNVEGVWDSNYMIVQHLDETSGTHYDSTVYGNNATNYGSDQDAVGKIDGANSFDGSSSYLEVPHDETITGFTDAFTASAWIKTDTNTVRQTIFCKYLTTGDQRGWMVDLYDDTGVSGYWTLQLSVSPNGESPHSFWLAPFQPVIGKWYHIAVVWESNQDPTFYINGEERNLVGGTDAISNIFNNDGTPLHIGKSSYSSGREFDGVIDELQVLDVALSSSWISTEYNMMNDSSNFTELGPVNYSETPCVSDESPADGAVEVSLGLSKLSFTLTDFQNDSMNYTVETMPNIGSDDQDGVNNGAYNVSVSGLQSSTIYIWYVNVTDGMYDSNETFTFTTESGKPIISNEQPTDGATGCILNPTLQADVEDLQSESVDWSIMSNVSGSWATLNSGTLGSGSGTVTATPTIMDKYGAMYYWSVNATDAGSGKWTNETFSFTTKQNYPPDTTPTPANGAIGIGLNPTLSVYASDVEGDQMNITISTNASGSWQILNSFDYEDNGTYDASTSYINSWGKKYWWRVNISDIGVKRTGTKCNNQTYSFTTLNPLAMWHYRKKIVIDHIIIKNTFTNFPFLIDINNDNDLVRHAQSNFNDILFTTTSVSWDTGTEQDKLSHEIVGYNSTTGNLSVWVNVTSLSSSEDTILYMYYGNSMCGTQENPDGVWNSDYKMVQHLDETSGTHYDSTVYGNNATNYGSDQDAVGKIDGANSFDGSSSYLEVPHDETITGFTDAFTASAWIKTDTNTARQTIFCKYLTTGDQRGWMVDLYDDTGVSGYWTLQLCASPNGESPHSFWLAPFQPVIGEWYYITVVWESNQEPTFYINGEERNVVGGTDAISNIFNNDGTPLHIGKSSYSSGREFDGVIDELQVLDVALSSNWVNTSYRNMDNPSSFYSVGSEIDINNPDVSDENPLDGATDISLSLSELTFKLTDYQGDQMNYSVETSPDIGSDNQSGVGNSTKSLTVTNLEGETTYTWYVNVTDGMYETNVTFTFTTESDEPMISDESPMDGATGVGMNPTLQADVLDLQGDSVDWSIMSNAIGSWVTLNSGTLGSGSGTVSASSSGMDAYGTMYYWSVNATDVGSGKWTNETFTFTTIDKIEVTNPHPGDGESWVSLNPELSIHVEDRHGDSFSVMFRTNASGIWRDIGGFEDVDNGTYNQTAQDMLQRDNTTYYWSVNASDGMGSWTNKTYTLNLVNYKGQRVQPVSKGFCWKLPDVRPAVEKGIYYENAMQGGGTWAKYDINHGWVKTYATLFNSGYCGHNTFGFWNNVYHVVDGSSSPPCHFELVDSLEANFESFSTVDKYEDLYFVGLGSLNFTDTCPRTYTFNNDKAWILTGEVCKNNDTWLVKYFPWTKESGWGNGVPIWETGHYSTSRKDFAPCLLRYNRTIWYLYYVYGGGGSYPMRYIKTTDAGQTWSGEYTCSDISCPASVATRTSFARYGNNFYIFIRDGNGDAVVYNSTDMENWGNKQVIDNSHNYWMVTGNMLHQSALICVGANNVEYVDDVYGMILPISEMIANPETPTNPYPANNTDLPSGTTTSYLNVTVHGDQVYDVAFYWANGTFIGEDKILEEGDIASIQVSGLQNNTDYEWYAIARGTIDEYIGREPLTMSDENWTDIFSFEVKAQPQPMITNEQPADGAVDINPTPTLQVTITDFQGDSVDWYIMSNASGSWTTLDSGTLPDGNGTVSNTSSLMDEYSKTYYWSVNASDGVLWTNETYQFTTIRGRPIISDEQPADGAVDVNPGHTLQVKIADLQGDSVDWYIMSNASGSWTMLESGTLSDGNGTVSTVPTVMDSYETMYYWSVNASDGLLWNNQTFYFTTVRGRPYVSDEHPENGAVGVDLNPTLKAVVTDMQNDSVDWWVMSNASDSWAVIASSTLPNGNGTITAGPVTMDEYNTTYYWSVNATDGVLWENKTYYFTSKAAPGPWWNEGWIYRKTITINHDFVYANSNLTDFPVLIDITDAELSAHSQPGGGDIVFTNYAGVKLSHEIESYDNSSGDLIVWVNVTSLSSDKETTLYMYYGNATCGNQEDPSGVWNNNYTMIHHLEEQTGTHYDSTSYANDGSPHGVTQGAMGQIDGADRFNETPALYSADISISSNGGNGYYTAIMNIQTGSVDGPVLKYSPRSHHFGNMYAGNTGSISFDIWNDGTEDTTFSCSEDCEWLNLPGVISGINHHGGGDIDTVDVDIDTTGLGPGYYSAEVEVLTGYGYCDVFTVYVHVIDSSVSSPLMFHDPDSYFFRNMGQDQTDSTTFEIWNGGTDTLSYTLSEDTEWVSVSPTSGSSTGEHDDITVSIDTSSILVGNYVEVDDDSSLDHADGEGFTYTAWINSEELSDFKAIMTHRDSGTDAVVGVWTSDNKLYCEVKNDGRTSTADGYASVNLSTDTWYYIGLTRSSSGEITLFINGNFYNIGSCTGDITPSEPLYIGWHSTGGQNFIGVIDEVRMSNIERSQNWILTSYNNQYNLSTFHTFGSEELNIDAPVISDMQPKDNAIEIDINPLLQATITDYQDDSVDWWIMSNATGSWSTIDSGTLPTGEGIVSTIPSNMNNYNTTYWWSINCTDGSHWNNQTFKFTTYQYAPGPWWNSSWLYRKMILINHSMLDTSSDFYNFPVLINISDDDLSQHAQFDGDDIAFTNYNGDQLAQEIEYYNGNDGNLIAWVNVTTLYSGSDTILYLYYGNDEAENQENPAGTWDSNYIMVQHLPHNWVPYEGNPVGVGGMRWHSVFKVNDTYYAYYHGSNQIERATSPDGKTWTDDNANNPVLLPSASGWDATIGVPWAWYENGTYYILYYGYHGTNAVGLATSSDGVNFTKYPNNINPQPVISSPAEPWGVMKVGDTYYEYYVNNGYMGNRVICLATSTDLINWTKYPGNPIFKTGVSEPDANGQFNSDVFTYNGYYYILIPHYTAGSDYSGIELYRDITPFFDESTREYLGFVLPCPHTATDQDTPAMLTDTVYRNSFNDSDGELWTYYAYGTNLAISSSIPQALKGAMRDSTIYGNHGVGDGVGGPTPCFCKIGGGYNFDGLDEYMVIEDKSSLDLVDTITLDVWVQLDTALVSQPNTYSGIVSKKDGDSGYALWFNCSDEVLVVSIGSVNVSVDVSGFDWTVWHQIIVTYDGSTLNVYIDKALIKSELVSGVIGVNDVDLWVGDLVDSVGNVIDGSVDEIRISNTARGWNWLNTSYNNQINPGLFYELRGHEQALAPIISNPNPANDAINISVSISQLSFKLEDLQNDPMDYTVETSPDIGSTGLITGVLNGIYSLPVSGLQFNTTYTWYVNVTDGIHITNQTFKFTTKSGKPIISNEVPKNGSTDVILNPTLQAICADYEGDQVNWYIMANSSDNWQTIDNGILPDGNGTINATPIDMNQYNTTYYWSVNVTDPTGSGTWVNETYSFTTELPPAPWWDESWMYRKTLTVDCSLIDVELSNFPVLIDITDADLAGHAQSNGDDIIFRDYYGNQYYHEIELYNSGHLVAWVNVTSLSSTENTTLYMYYGNPTCGNQESPEDVWDSNFVMVQHLRDETTSTTSDSTSNDNDGTKKGANEPLETTGGKMDGAQDFDGSDDYIGIADNDGLDHLAGEGFTYTAWIKSDFLDSYRAVVTHRDPGSDAMVGLWTFNNNALHAEVKNDGRTSQASGDIGVSLSTGTWYYVGLTRTNAGAIDVWHNGISYSLGTCTGNITPSEPLYIGRHSTAATQYFDGVIDEVRLSNIRRSDSWIAACYNNQNNPNAFYNVGTEEEKIVEEPVISNEQPEDDSTNIDLNPTLQANISDDQGDTVDWWIISNATGNWLTINNGTLPDGNGTVSASPTTMNNYDTMYWWSVNTTDPGGSGSWTNVTYYFTTKSAPATWWNTSWHLRREITINHTMVNSMLTNFPVLIRMVDADLASHAQSDGDDIVFADYFGTQLNHEIEYYNSSTGELVCWVNVNSVSSDTDTVLYMYYSNPSCSNQENISGAMDQFHKLVLHLHETSGIHSDSTIYGNSGSPSGGIDQDATGIIDGADEFDGINSQITVTDDNSLDFGTNSFTITCWINLTKTATYQGIVQKRQGGDQGFYFDVRSNGLIEAKIEDVTTAGVTGILTTSDVCTGNWRYIAGVFDRTGNKMIGYVDGIKELEVDILSITDTINTSTNLHIGYYDSAFPANGVIDEIRVSETKRSVDWINTSYLNQRYPTAFYSVGGTESFGAGEPMVSDETPEDGSTGIDLNPTLQARITDFEDDSVTWYIMSNSSGSWTTLNSGTLPSGNGMISAIPTTMNNYDTTYYWSINVTDPSGSGNWTNMTYSFTTTFAPGPWWNTGWLYRKAILVDHDLVDANSDLINFPVLISFTDSDLSDHAQFDGDDIVFTDYSGNRLHHEIEFYDGNVGELVAWVNVTALSSTSDTLLYIYYGNTTCDNQEHISDVWDSDYRMVQHLPHNWIPYEGNPISAPGTSMQWHSVFKVNDTYYAYYHGSNQINRATSPDGKTWTDDTANNPVLPPSASGWDSTIGVPWAWYENGTYYILYYGYSGTQAIGLATSSDGVNFMKYPNNTAPQPVLTDEPWGVMKVNDTYYEYYVDNSGPGGRCICLATSTDLVNWTKDPNNPIFSLGEGDPDSNGCFNSDVFKYGDYYYILIPHYTSGSDYARIVMYRDTSPTFYPEDREYMGPVKPVSHTAGWESTDQDTAAVLTDTVYRDSFNASDGELWMYYNGCCPRKQGLTISPSIPQALKGAMRDSTVFSNHGEGDGVGGPVPGFGKIGGGYNFDGLDEYMVVDDNFSLDLNDTITLETWVQLDTALSSQPNSYAGIISKKEGDSGYALWFNCSDEVLVVSVGTVNVSVDVSSYDWTIWHQIIVSYDGSTLDVYIDKVLIRSESATGVIGVNDVDLWAGDLVDNVGNVTDGNIDEIRISDKAREWNWINTSYNNQQDPSGFSVVGSEEVAPADTIPPEISDVTVTMSDPIDTDPLYGWENITCTVTDNLGVHSVFVNITYPDLHTESHLMTDGGGGQYYYNTTYTAVGSYSYHIWANDTSDNSNTSSVDTFEVPPNWDINMDGICNIIDVSRCSVEWMNSSSNNGWIREDINNDGNVNIIDVSQLSVHWLETW